MEKNSSHLKMTSLTVFDFNIIIIHGLTLLSTSHATYNVLWNNTDQYAICIYTLNVWSWASVAGPGFFVGGATPLRISNYWMRLSRIWRILQIKEGVIHRGRRPRWITSSEICRILHILRNGETPLKTGGYFEWIIKQLLNSAFVSPVPELSFLPAPYRGWTRACERRVQDNLHAHAQNAAIFPP